MKDTAIVVLAGLALALGLATTASAQETLETDVFNEDSPIAFEAVDTIVEEARDRPADERETAPLVSIRGPETTMDPAEDEDTQGQRVYLLGLSPSGARDVPDDVRNRYANGTVDNATLELSFNRESACNSPNGQLTIRTVETRTWNPFSIAWEDASVAGGDVNVEGPTLAQVPLNPDGIQANGDYTCSSAQIDLDPDDLDPLFTAEKGGLAMFWRGEQPLNVSTLDDRRAPELQLSFTKNAPWIEAIDPGEDWPVVLDGGDRLEVRVAANDTDPLPENAVSVNLTNESGQSVASIDALQQGQLFVASQTIPPGSHGVYDLDARVEDGDGWSTKATPNASGPHVLVDEVAPRIEDARLAAQPANGSLDGPQGETLPLRANVSDLSCEHGASPCGEWTLTWRDRVLANGTLTPRDPRIEADVHLPRPGIAPARLEVRDAAGHANDILSWNLTIADTQPPTAKPLEGTLLAPDRSATIEKGTAATLALQILDDPPVEAELDVDGPQPQTISLPEPGPDGRIDHEIEDLAVGDHSVQLVLDDGNHTRRLAWGQLTVAPEDAPAVHVPVTGTRLSANDTLPVEVRDRNLDPNRIEVDARVNGLTVQANVETSEREDGVDLAISFDELEHGDTVNVTVRAQDEQGRVSSAGAVLEADTRAPELTSPEAEAWFEHGDRVTFEAQDPGDGEETITVQGQGPTRTGPSPLTLAVESLASETGYRVPVSVRLSDDVGNEHTRELSIGIDDAPPQANATFTQDGLVIEAEDAASGVLRVDAQAGIDGAELEEVQVFRDSPTQFFVATGPLTRGQQIQLAAQVRDNVGHRTHLGTQDDPLELTVPDRPPTLSIERASETVAETGHVNWSATDPDQDEISANLVVETPSGEQRTRSVDPIGSHAIEPDEPGRYTVTLEATSAGNTTETSTFFYLSPDGRLTSSKALPDRVDPGSELTVELSFPQEPEQVYVTAVDEAGASTSAEVELTGRTAKATFHQLPEGDYELESTVVYEEGAVERATFASVQSQEPLGQRLSDLIVPLLVVLAILLIVAIAVVWYKRRREEQEEADPDSDPAT